MSKESFKVFVKNNPSLSNYVINNQMTWQKFYEMYDLYGEKNEIWDKYLNNSKSLLGDTSLKDIFNIVKGIDLDSVKKGVDGLQKAVLLAQDIMSTKTKQIDNYERRPLYRNFED